MVFLAAASPFDTLNGTTNGINSTNAPLWSGDVPGHGYAELYGDAHEVLKQIFALNPALQASELYQADYNPYMDPEPRPFNDSAYEEFNKSYFYKGFLDIYKNQGTVSRFVAGLSPRGDMTNHDMSSLATFWSSFEAFRRSYLEH